MRLLYVVTFTLLSAFSFAQDSLNHFDYKFASIQYLIEQEVGRIVLPQIYSNVGFEISIEPLPAPRAEHFANSGEMDGEIMRIWSYGNENLNTIRVPTPYYYLETMPFVLQDNVINIPNKEALNDYKIAKVRGVKHTDNITRNMNHVYEAISTNNMFKLVEKRKVDVALTNTLDGMLVLKQFGFKNIVATNLPLAKLPLYHYIHKKHKHLVPLIDNEIKRLTSTGELKLLLQAAEAKVTRQSLYPID